MDFNRIAFVKLRKERKLTQEAIGSLIGVNKATISCWETGERYPHKSNLEQVATALNVPLSTFCEVSPIPNNPKDMQALILQKLDIVIELLNKKEIT